MRSPGLGIVAAALALSGCQGTYDPSITRQSAAYKTIPATDPVAPLPPYKIGPFDTIDINVFQEPDLTQRGLKVDASGTVAMPLIGEVQASGLTSEQLADAIKARLSEKYLESPQVMVSLVQSISQRVTVEGSVTEAGVYAIQGHMSLVQAVALAKGPSRVAALKEVAVFRTIDGHQYGALFNLDDIRRGKAPDPTILGNDVVVVGFSSVKSAYRDVLSAAPLLSVFSRIY